MEDEDSTLCYKCGQRPFAACKKCGEHTFNCKSCNYASHKCREGVSREDQFKNLEVVRQQSRQEFERALLEQELRQERDQIARIAQIKEEKYQEELLHIQNEYNRKVKELTSFYQAQQTDYQARTKEIIDKYEFTIESLEAEKKETEDGLKNTTSQREELRNQLEQLRQEFQNLKKEEKPKSDKLPRVAKLKSKKRSEEED
jgi:chromosome segregation ATPase